MRQALRASLGLVVMTATIVATTPAAFAGGGGGNGDAGAGVGAGGVIVTVGTPGSPGKPGGGSGSSPAPSCGLEYIDGKDLPSLVDNSTQGYWVVDTCKLGLVPGALTWVPTTPGGSAPIPSVIAKTALSKAAWPTIKVDFNPSPDRLLVNFPTWLHLTSGWRTITASASVAGISATVTAKPESVQWEMGDGTTVTCHSAGTAYDAHLSWQANLTARDCGYSYTTSSSGSADGRYSVTVTVHYAVTWTSNAGGGGSLGGYDRKASTNVAVGQIESLEN